MQSTAALILFNVGVIVAMGSCPFHHGAPRKLLNTQGCRAVPTSCQNSKYRSFDGSCNNLEHGDWGTPMTSYNRLLPPNYASANGAPTRAKSGNQLPLARLVSSTVAPSEWVEDKNFTLAAMQYAQFISHDLSLLAASPTVPVCCVNGRMPEEKVNPSCYQMEVPADDPSYAGSNITCLNFVRTLTDKGIGCTQRNAQPEQISSVNHFLDLSIVYGNSKKDNDDLREFSGGRLLSVSRNNQVWLPNVKNAASVCLGQEADEVCYLAGDSRADQNPQLTILHTIWLREHNRIADALASLNPHWDDETLFQEARRIASAEHQYISYYEWLPIFMGKQNAIDNGVIYETRGFIDDYRKDVNPSILNEFATAAFRYFHSNIAGYLKLVSEDRSIGDELRLSDWYFAPSILEHNDTFNDLIRGLATQPEMEVDQYYDKEITVYLFRYGEKFGNDLKATDIQRNRDHGLPSYNDMRATVGLHKAKTFDGFLDHIAQEAVDKLANLYESVDDVDLTVAGSMEVHVKGTLLGPTFLSIHNEQFYRSRVADRYFFENGHPEFGFTLEQLNQIRQASLSRLICDNSDVKSIQRRSFEVISNTNPLQSCDELPRVDLLSWEEIEDSTTLLPKAYYEKEM